ncbi:MAG: RNA polymerase II mediator complex subunit [Stictis urceolatum]|nr:RNA polymerase II mediator complex subunit [Stictis urceolata]
MAPNPLDTVDDELKKTINSLYTLQSSTHGYLGNETQAALAGEAKNLVSSLAKLQSLARPSGAEPHDPNFNPNAPKNSALPALLPPEVIGYVDEGRNPDVYTREFVELVQRGNAYLKGKSEGLKGLKDALAQEIVKEWPEMEGIVGKVLKGEGGGVDGLVIGAGSV